MTSYTDTDLTEVIHGVLRSARRTLSDADLAADIERAVREHLAVECRDGHVVAPDVHARIERADGDVRAHVEVA